MYYATEFLKDLNIGGSGGAYFQTILIGVCSFIATFISLFTIDKFGRKPLMVIGTIGTGSICSWLVFRSIPEMSLI